MGRIRLTSGRFRGRMIETPEGEGTRPLLTRLRKTLADLLRPRLPGARVLDLFGGSGAIAFELLSNGAASAVVIELDPVTAELVRRNAAGLGACVEVLCGDALAVVPRLGRRPERFQVAIVAPPYEEGLQPLSVQALASADLLVPGGLLVVQRDFREPCVETEEFRLDRTRRYGRTIFDFYLRDHGG